MKYAHMGFFVSDVGKSKEFYSRALAPLGGGVVAEGEGWISFGQEGRTALWLGSFGTPATSIHYAFEADTREQVDAFYTAALGAGGRDNGAPGIRAQYSPTYYAAFVFDPDGHNVEVVCFK